MLTDFGIRHAQVVFGRYWPDVFSHFRLECAALTVRDLFNDCDTRTGADAALPVLVAPRRLDGPHQCLRRDPRAVAVHVGSI